MDFNALARWAARLYICSLSISFCAPLLAAQFIPLYPQGDFTNTRASGVSSDGSTVVGEVSGAAIGQSQPFYWNAANGVVPMGYLDGYTTGTGEAFAASQDGSTIVGRTASANGSREAFVWNSQSGLVGLGDLAGGQFYSQAMAVSDDGAAIAGVGHTGAENKAKATLWYQPGNPLNMEENSSFTSFFTGISGDGSTVVGGGGALVWTEDSGMVRLGSLSAQGMGATAHDASFDGSVIVGESVSDNLQYEEAFRWTEEAGMVGLGALTGSNRSKALAVSGDGNTIVGESDGAFVWTEGAGMQSLHEILFMSGTENIEEWTLIRATGVSSDGNIIVGDAVDPYGNQTAFYVNLSPIPIPTTGWLFLSAIAGLFVTKRKLS